MGSLPPILWYLLAVVAFAVFPLTMVFAIHRHHMKVLELPALLRREGHRAATGGRRGAHEAALPAG